MINKFSPVGSSIAHTIEAVGVIIIAIGFIYAGISAVHCFKRKDRNTLITDFRKNIKSNMVLGLDFLVAGDIIRTVTVNPTLSGVASLGLLVVIWTMLVFTIHLEVHGRWPWQGEEVPCKSASPKKH
ncbi:hypothetical protein PM10SUCC1_04780 [Propionigenium maris DSM 9537]|uniref:Uncharacterized protein n=1 Tax=Propionigenium maris DSM 9537 TaxID=1123000 RepID=A0A9W6LM15_9FUSO|nr:DUF1622 domain-containing protein [Propionigenium maris]GLI54963.1 hypothetical protein PM10SUCC1_04780 [Propionigenium maris DSM 9537]